MCTLMLLYRTHPEFPLIVAANRDERFDRPSAPPGVLRENPRAVGGKDLVAGGTWLGLNEHGLLVAVTNRRGGVEDPARRSRGLLVLDALGLPDAGAVARLAARQAETYNPLNLLAVGPEGGFVVTHAGGGAHVQPVAPGPLVLTTGDPNDRQVPNVARGLRALAGLGTAPEAELVARLQAACADHDQEDPAYPPFCLHRRPFGTVSSTILLLRPDGSGRYLFAPGPPCTTCYDDLSRRLRGALQGVGPLSSMPPRVIGRR